MDLVTKALRAGEGRKFKAYQKRAEAINRFEPEMEALSDEEIREEADELRQRARETAPRSTTCCPRRSRSAARPRAAPPASATTTSS